MYAIWFDIHIVKQQEIVAYVSPVEVFATRIKTLKRQKLFLIAWLLPSEGLDLQEFKGQRCGIPKWPRLWHRNKELTVFRNCKCIVQLCTMQKCYAQIIDFVPEHYAQNIETSCWNIMFKIQTLCSKANETFQLCARNIPTCTNSELVIIHKVQDNGWRTNNLHQTTLVKAVMMSGQIWLEVTVLV